MPWIEGVGNEVTLFFACVLVLSLGFLAWLSTKISNRPLNRTVVIVHRRRTHSYTSLAHSAEPTSIETSHDDATVEQTEGDEATAVPQIENADEHLEQDNYISDSTTAGESDVATECLEFHSTHPSTDESPIPRENERNDVFIRNRQRISLFEKRSEPLIADEEAHSSPEIVDATLPDSEVDPGNIRIRLKYITDEQRLVQGRLQESLGEFKIRHFVSELSAQKLVRLIFNGHILQRDNETLQEHGLFDNCVVHCLVHQRQTTPETPANHNAVNNNDAAPNREWNLGTLFFVLLMTLISFAWYCRFQYGQLFNITTTFTLIGLSGIFFVSLLGLYFSDPEGIRN